MPRAIGAGAGDAAVLGLLVMWLTAFARPAIANQEIWAALRGLAGQVQRAGDRTAPLAGRM
jgi:hypothetical protein